MTNGPTVLAKAARHGAAAARRELSGPDALSAEQALDRADAAQVGGAVAAYWLGYAAEVSAMTSPWPAPDPATRHRETFNRGAFRWVTLPDPTELVAPYSAGWAITYAAPDPAARVEPYGHDCEM